MHLEEPNRKDCFEIEFKDKTIKNTCARYDVIHAYAQKDDEHFYNFYLPKLAVAPLKKKVSVCNLF